MTVSLKMFCVKRLCTHNNAASVKVTDPKRPMWGLISTATCFVLSPLKHEEYSIFKLFAAVSDRSPSRLDLCGWRAFHLPSPFRSYLNGLYNYLLCPETTRQIIILCSNVWQEKLLTITKRAGVFLFPSPSRPSLSARSRKGCVQG